VTRLRQIMLEELRRAISLSQLSFVSTFTSRYSIASPISLGPSIFSGIRRAVHCVQFRFSPNTVTLRLALRLFCIQVLEAGWSIAETPYPKKTSN
jgi:hypothetical protein